MRRLALWLSKRLLIVNLFSYYRRASIMVLLSRWTTPSRLKISFISVWSTAQVESYSSIWVRLVDLRQTRPNFMLRTFCLLCNISILLIFFIESKSFSKHFLFSCDNLFNPNLTLTSDITLFVQSQARKCTGWWIGLYQIDRFWPLKDGNSWAPWR